MSAASSPCRRFIDSVTTLGKSCEVRTPLESHLVRLFYFWLIINRTVGGRLWDSWIFLPQLWLRLLMKATQSPSFRFERKRHKVHITNCIKLPTTFSWRPPDWTRTFRPKCHDICRKMRRSNANMSMNSPKDLDVRSVLDILRTERAKRVATTARKSNQSMWLCAVWSSYRKTTPLPSKSWVRGFKPIH